MSEKLTDSIFVRYDAKGNVLHAIVHFIAKTNPDSVLLQRCKSCGRKSDWEEIIISEVVKVVNVTDTTNTPVEEENLIEEGHPLYEDIMKKAHETFRHEQMFPDMQCQACWEREEIALRDNAYEDKLSRGQW